MTTKKRARLGSTVTNILFAILIYCSTFTQKFNVIPLVSAQATPLKIAISTGPWDLTILQNVPSIRWGNTTEFPRYTLKEVYYSNETYQGQATWVFAYLAIPKDSGDQPLPAMVLVHGGGGSAYQNWVAQWAQRGYVAIAMDLSGNGPNHQRLTNGGPPQNDATTFTEISVNSIKDMWPYHAVAAVIRSISVLAALPEVDPSRIGIMGISWGGYLSAIVVGLDQRLTAAIIVYGTGYYSEDSYWKNIILNLSQEQQSLWVSNFDPKQYLTQSSLPIFWATGTNDFAFPLNSWQKSYQLGHGTNLLRIIPNWPHNNETPWNTFEFQVFADQHLVNGPSLPQISGPNVRDDMVVLSYKSTFPINKAELHFTIDTTRFSGRTWQSIQFSLRPNQAIVIIPLPPRATALFVNLITSEGLIISSDLLISPSNTFLKDLRENYPCRNYWHATNTPPKC